MTESDYETYQKYHVPPEGYFEPKDGPGCYLENLQSGKRDRVNPKHDLATFFKAHFAVAVADLTLNI